MKITERFFEIVDEVGKIPVAGIDDLAGTIAELQARGYTAYLDPSTDYLCVGKTSSPKEEGV
ncbi:MAG: hypothetical protein M0P69_08175 [Bacteroidales bacterium]|nr:hypothetical protein [Bacteroidales bacterium]